SSKTCIGMLDEPAFIISLTSGEITPALVIIFCLGFVFSLCLFLRSPPAQFLIFDPFLFVLVLLSARVLRCINDEPSLPSYALDNCSQDRFLSPFPTPLQFFGSVCDGKG
uniref:Uncharacterized protein n=1 Tax=Aegilops tauschii subsp. strangulata TaxID=200361 RepID=A0A453NWE8_AEGTS